MSWSEHRGRNWRPASDRRCQRRITDEQTQGILSSIEGLGIALRPVAWPQMLSLALRFGRSAYDAAYLALAQATDQPLVTGDLRLYNAVREHLNWVKWTSTITLPKSK